MNCSSMNDVCALGPLGLGLVLELWTLIVWVLFRVMVSSHDLFCFGFVGLGLCSERSGLCTVHTACTQYKLLCVIGYRL